MITDQYVVEKIAKTRSRGDLYDGSYGTNRTIVYADNEQTAKEIGADILDTDANNVKVTPYFPGEGV